MQDTEDITVTSDENSKDEALLEELRSNYRYGCDMWKQAKDERAIDMRYLQGDPWTPWDRKARKEADRPCISHDELNQYVNQAVNSARMNKRGVKIEPEGDGANDKSAEFRQNKVRAIEYNSMASSIYLQSYQNEVEGGYGFCRIARRYRKHDSDEQEICIKPIPNPDSVVYDPDCKEPDWSDAQWCFVLDPLSKAEFRKRWPKAKVKDFSVEDMRIAKDWIQDRTVLTAEYWRVEEEDSGKKTPKGRPIKEKKIVQYWTNGIEILERNEEPGTEIPIPAFIGMERWVDDGSGPKRHINSLVRFARDPQMSLAYLCSQQMEEAGLTPKTPYIGYTGQFETDEEAWSTASKVPHSFLQADPITDSSNGQILPLPQRQSFTPNFQAYELAKDSCRRAIQAAMGITPLPTAAQRNNEKSGIALQQIASQQSIGSFHFADGYDRALQRAGRIIESWIDVTYDTERETSLRLPDDTHKVVRINTDTPQVDEKGQVYHYQVADQGDHQVTVSTGPSNESQRAAADDFLNALIANMGKLPIPPPQQAKLLAMAIQMKQLGPKGDQMAEIISPEEQQQQQPPSPQVAQAMQQMQGQVQALTALNQKLEFDNQKLMQEKQGSIVDNEYKLQMKRMDIEADLAKAEITTKSQVLNERVQFIEDLWKQLHSQAHEANQADLDRQHEQQQTEQQALLAQQQQQQQQAPEGAATQ